jgi:hypothetical protein
MRCSKLQLQLIPYGAIVQAMNPIAYIEAVRLTRRAARGALATDPTVAPQDRRAARQPLTTPIGRSSATRAARPARSTTPTTRSTAL